MTRPVLEVADILHAQGDAFVAQHPWLSVQQRSVLRAIARCRTAALGGHVDQCDACGYQALSYNSCLMVSTAFWGAPSRAGQRCRAMPVSRPLRHSP